MAQVIFLFEDSFPELMTAHTESLKFTNAVVESEYFMTSPEVGQKFKNMIDSTIKSRNATMQIIQLMEEVHDNVKSKSNFELLKKGK